MIESMRAREFAAPGAWTLAVRLCWLVALMLSAEPAAAQGFRGWVGTSVQMVEIRPLGLDSVGRADVVLDADGRYLYDGHQVYCVVQDICTSYGTRAKQRAVAASQDVSLTAWGFGVPGLSATMLLRARTSLGSELLWPRANDEFDAMLGYAQLVRGAWRFRGGRQEVRSGLGFSAFDGGSAVFTRGSLRLEAYGGRSLARALREPVNTALRGIEDFLPDQGVHLLGGAAQWRVAATAVTTRYHREVLSDRSGLASERGSVDVSTVVTGTRVTGSLDYDFGFGHVGKGHLTLGRPLSGGRWLVEASARRYVPYFDLSTIWGFFEPVAYSEAELRASWSPRSTLGGWVSGGWRRYGNANTTIILEPLTDDGWRANAGIRWQPLDDWQLQGSYRLEWGPGSFLNSGDLSARYHHSDRLSATATMTTFQQIEEFRLGDGRAIGGGMSFDLGVTDRTLLSGGLSVLRHRGGGTTSASPWNQTRAWTSLRIELGSDPGLTSRRQP